MDVDRVTLAGTATAVVLDGRRARLFRNDAAVDQQPNGHKPIAVIGRFERTTHEPFLAHVDRSASLLGMVDAKSGIVATTVTSDTTFIVLAYVPVFAQDACRAVAEADAVEFVDDPTWRRFVEDFAENSFTRWDDALLARRLAADGDRLDRTRPITHALVSSSRRRLQSAVSEARRGGFRLDDAGDAHDHGHDAAAIVVKSEPVTPAGPVKSVEWLNEVAERHGCEYWGWHCRPVREPKGFWRALLGR